MDVVREGEAGEAGRRGRREGRWRLQRQARPRDAHAWGWEKSSSAGDYESHERNGAAAAWW